MDMIYNCIFPKLMYLILQIIYSWVPTRSQLLGQGDAHSENIEVLTKYLPTMRAQLDRIDVLLKEHNLDDVRKV